MNAENRWFVSRALIVLGLSCAFALGIMLLWFTRVVLLLLFTGLLLAILLRALAEKARQYTGLPIVLSILLVVVASICLAGLGGYLIGPRVADQGHKFIETLPGDYEKAQSWLRHSPIGKILSVPKAGAAKPSTGITKIMGTAAGFLSSTIWVVVSPIIVLLFAIFMAVSPEIYIEGIIKLIPPARRERAREVLDQVGHTLRWWLVGVLIDMSMVGVLSAVGLYLLKVPLALVLGILAGLLTAIPIVGPILSVFPAILIAMANNPLQGFYVVLLYIGIHIVEGYIASPMIQSRTVYLPPLLTLAVITLGMSYGILGAVVATPVTAAAMVLIRMLYVEDILNDRGSTEQGAGSGKEPVSDRETAPHKKQ
ncbi:MAG: AI-2E family transporter [Syntrophobacteraceae bacterium]